MITVKIENAYSDKHTSETEVLVDPPTADDKLDPELDDWFQEVVYPHTGDGHGIGTDLGSCYTATIIAADDAELIGKTYEWID